MMTSRVAGAYLYTVLCAASTVRIESRLTLEKVEAALGTASTLAI